MMAGDQQQYSLAPANSLFEHVIDRLPCAIQIHAMKVEHSIRFDRTRLKAAIPRAVESRADLPTNGRKVNGPFWRGLASVGCSGNLRWDRLGFNGLLLDLVA